MIDFFVLAIIVFFFSMFVVNIFSNTKDKTNELFLNELIVKNEIKKLKQIEEVNNFLKDAKQLNIIAYWKNKEIYNYIYKNGLLYKFENTLSEFNNLIVINDDELCFNNLVYKRVHNPSSELINQLV